MADRTEQSVPSIQDIAAIPQPSSPPAIEEHLEHVTIPPDLSSLGDHVITHIDGEAPVDTAPAIPSGFRKEFKAATISILCASMSAFLNWKVSFVSVAWVWLVVAAMVLFLPAAQGEEVFDCGVWLGERLAMAIVRFCETALGRPFARVLDEDEDEKDDEEEDGGAEGEGEEREDVDDEKKWHWVEVGIRTNWYILLTY